MLMVAALVMASQQGLVKTARYLLPFFNAEAVTTSVVPVALGMSVQGPLPTITCHCTMGTGLPLAAAVSTALTPGQSVWLSGCSVTFGMTHDLHLPAGP